MHPLKKVSIVTLFLVGLSLPFALYAAFQLPIGSAGVHEWLPEGREERERYKSFSSRFGSDQVLLVSWEGASFDDERVIQFVERMQSLVEQKVYFQDIVSPVAIIESLEQGPLQLERSEAVKRLYGSLVGEDGTVSILILMTESGARQHKLTIEQVRKIGDEIDGLGRATLRMVGNVYESYAVDEAAEASLSKLVPPSSLLGVGMCWFCLRSLRATIAVMLLSLFGQLVAVAMVYYTGRQFSAVLVVLPTLIFMLTLSGAIHLVNYFLDASRSGQSTSGVSAIKKGWWPCALSSFTTMLGMGSLLMSGLVPVREFGLFASAALGLATLQLLLAFPSLIDLLHQSPSSPVRTFAADVSESESSWLVGYLNWHGRWVNSIVVVGIVLLVFQGGGLWWLRSSTSFCDMFPADHKTSRDMRWFEDHIGPISSVEVLLTFPHDTRFTVLDQVHQVVRTVNELKRDPCVGGAYSAIAYLPKLNEKAGTRGAVIRSIQRMRIEESLPNLQTQGLVYQSENATTWRISARVSAISRINYGDLTRSIHETTSQALANFELQPKIEVTGLSPVMHETQVALLSDLGYSFLSAFLLITPVMMITVRSVFGGLLVMIPNVLPVTLAFGTMGWAGWSLDIAGILTASIALGIAVDDTLHFVCWYVRELRVDGSPKAAVKRTFRGCAKAMVHTSVISCCSMAPLLFAEFIPTQQFAKLMIIMLSAALVGDLVLLPALLISPLGRFVRPKHSHQVP